MLKKVEKISLDGIWILKNPEKSIETESQVPGTVFEALVEKNIIEDPFYGENEHKMKWVYQTNWTYEREFDVEQEFVDHKRILLRFYGLDTIADVYLNDELIGSVDNMFVRYDFEVKSMLKNEGNKLIVKFFSPTLKAKEFKDKFGFNLNTGYAAIPGVPYLRKAQYSFGWDWGPKLPDVGIWKNVELIGFDDVKIESVFPYSNLKYNIDPLNITNSNELSKIEITSVKLFIDVELALIDEEILGLNYKIKGLLKSPIDEIFTKEIPLNKKKETLIFDIHNPLLWWTNDLGHPNLYKLEISTFKDEVLECVTQEIGLRDIQLVRKLDNWGETFYFLLNGIPIFAKGANWIPVDSFIPRGKKQGLYSMNLHDAKKANMNMIRVWGGGIYEDDSFYDLCDKLGVLVWQDFPFACALYPYQEKFVESV
ncbi:MAG: glycoside hydrolase family 2 protein, partial [Promethearchaeota archaeon]